MFLKSVVMITILLSLCFAQETAEAWFIQARCYEMAGHDSLALKAYKEAYSQDPNPFLKDVLSIRYLRVGQFNKVDSISKENLNEYSDGNKIAEFYCYVSDTIRAYDFWQKLIYSAVEARQLDSALILADSFAKNLPQYAVPKKMQVYLVKKIKKSLNVKDTKSD